jgi:hypothetical protein
VTKLKGQGGSVSSLASVSDEEGNGDGVKRTGNTEDMAAALVRGRGGGREGKGACMDVEGNGDGVKRSGNTEDMAAALVSSSREGRGQCGRFLPGGQARGPGALKLRDLVRLLGASDGVRNVRPATFL